MSIFRVYLKPFDSNGEYVSDYIDVTDDVIKLGDMTFAVDNEEYDVGVVRTNPITLMLKNDHGRYGEVDSLKSIFKFKVRNTLAKITWDFRNEPLYAGQFYPGIEVLGQEVTIAKGVINDLPATSDIKDQNVGLKIIAQDSMLNDLEVPYSEISNGDNLSDILFELLNQAPFNEVITVDASNINVGIDTQIDDKTSWEGATVGDILQDVLLATNSILYIQNDTVYIADRTPSVDLKYTFYGQASINGLENIVQLDKITTGLNRVFNYWRWSETALVAKDTSSIANYGVQKKEMNLDVIDVSSTSKITAILEANRDEFKNPQKEFELTTPIDYDRLDLNLLDKVQVDYPTVYEPFDNNPLPRYGLVRYGEARYPYGQYALTIDPSRRFKILSKKIEVNKQVIVYRLREIAP